MKLSDILTCANALQQLFAASSRSAWFNSVREKLVTGAKKSQNKVLLASEWADASATAPQHYPREELVALPEVMSYKPWTLLEWIRWQLLADMLLVQPTDTRKAFLCQCLRYADDAEKQSLIKGLELLDPQGESKDVVVNLFRSHNLDVLTSIALGNPWPAAHFADEEFEQVILKSLHLNFDIGKVVGLKQRHTVRTSQIAFDFLVQQYLANRQCHSSIYLAIQISDLLPQQLEQITTLPEAMVAALNSNRETHS